MHRLKGRHVSTSQNCHQCFGSSYALYYPQLIGYMILQILVGGKYFWVRMHKRYGRVVMPPSADEIVWHCFLAADAFSWLCCRCHGIWNTKKFLGFIMKRMLQPFSYMYDKTRACMTQGNWGDW